MASAGATGCSATEMAAGARLIELKVKRPDGSLDLLLACAAAPRMAGRVSVELGLLAEPVAEDP